jgi:excisionase family DNA binding protein
MQLEQAPSVLKVSEVAHRLKVDPRTVYRMIQRGELHGVKTGRVWRVTLESLERFLQPERSAHHSGEAARLPTAGGEPTQRVSAEEHAARVRAIRGKYRDALPSVDEYIAQKQAEIALENRRWPPEER